MLDMLILDLSGPEGWKAEFTLVLVIYWDGLPVCRQSSIQVQYLLLDCDWTGSWTNGLVIASPVSYCYATKPLFTVRH